MTMKLTVVSNIQIDSNKVEMVEARKFLGIIRKSSLGHISLINHKVSKSIGILKCYK